MSFLETKHLLHLFGQAILCEYLIVSNDLIVLVSWLILNMIWIFVVLKMSFQLWQMILVCISRVSINYVPLQASPLEICVSMQIIGTLCWYLVTFLIPILCSMFPVLRTSGNKGNWTSSLGISKELLSKSVYIVGV